MTVVAKTSLTPVERRVVELIAEGYDTEEIAEEMFISRYTVRSKIRRIRDLVGGGRMVDLPGLVERFERV